MSENLARLAMKHCFPAPSVGESAAAYIDYCFDLVLLELKIADAASVVVPPAAYAAAFKAHGRANAERVMKLK